METVRGFTDMNREMEYCRKKRGTSVRCKRRMLNKSSSEMVLWLEFQNSCKKKQSNKATHKSTHKSTTRYTKKIF